MSYIAVQLVGWLHCGSWSLHVHTTHYTHAVAKLLPWAVVVFVDFRQAVLSKTPVCLFSPTITNLTTARTFRTICTAFRWVIAGLPTTQKPSKMACPHVESICKPPIFALLMPTSSS